MSRPDRAAAHPVSRPNRAAAHPVSRPGGLVRRLLLALAAAAAVFFAWPAASADAHPLGNFSVNEYQGIVVHRDKVVVTAVVDAAEIPTLQERSDVDRDGDGAIDDAERARYAATQCTALAAAFTATAGHDRLHWTVSAPGYAYTPGSGGLPTSRLSCTLTAKAHVDGTTTLALRNGYRTDRVGWREMTAVGAGVRLVHSPLPTTSVSHELRAYPVDLLSSQLDVRSATLTVAPGSGGGGTATTASLQGDAVNHWMAVADARFQRLAAGHRLTPLVGVLAVLVAILLGAGHAALPGHGKTVMAAYLAGKRGRVRDAMAVGVTVTLTHTGAVLVIGLLLSTSSALAGDRLVGYLGVVSGALVTAVGVGMLVNVLRRHGKRGRPADHHHGHGHHHGHDHDHDHDHGHDHDHHGHDHDHDHDHGHDHDHPRPSRLSIAGIGLAGGLVPSPSALVVLLGAIGLGRAGFGVLLVLGYGLGMAGALIGAGLLLVVVQRRIAAGTGWARLAARFAPLTARVPAATATFTAGLVVVVGLGLAARAAAGVI